MAIFDSCVLGVLATTYADKRGLRSKFGRRNLQGFVVFYPLLYSPKGKNLVQRPEGKFLSCEAAANF